MTTREEIQDWFRDGKSRAYSYMIVVCDTYDHDDYPVYTNTDRETLDQYDHYNGKNMQRVMEVYDLRLDEEEQLNEHRSMHLPKENRQPSQ